eukprot:gene3224-3742_t
MEPEAKRKPVVCLVVGMAGSGKTTLMQQLTSHCDANNIPAFVINLDPAVAEVPYEYNIDISDTVNYSQVMKTYKLGPNGAIMTSLNLFATRFDQNNLHMYPVLMLLICLVIKVIEDTKDPIEYVLVDTPGQIEVFTWSASGQIISEAFSSAFPTVVLYVADLARCTRPVTFMSNMTYACSILYKSQLPFLLLLNKADVAAPDNVLKWVSDWDAYTQALDQDTSYSAGLCRSLSQMLEEFYKNLACVPVSAVTGQGVPELLSAIGGKADEYVREFLPFLQQKIEARKAGQMAVH